MASDYTLYHLQEAASELAELIKEFQEDSDDFGPGSRISEVYHHLNSAWNSRAADKATTDACSEENWFHWRRFPDDLLDNFTGKKA